MTDTPRDPVLKAEKNVEEAREKVEAAKALKKLRLEKAESKQDLNRSDVVTILAHEMSVSTDDADKFLEKFLGLVVRKGKERKRISITGFGSFTPAELDQRRARNPQTGEAVRVPKKNIVKFHPGARFFQYLNGRPLPKDAPIIGKALPESGSSVTDYAPTGRTRRKFVKKEKV